MPILTYVMTGLVGALAGAFAAAKLIERDEEREAKEAAEEFEAVAQVFCDDYCRRPRERGSQTELEQCCDGCALMCLERLIKGGGEKNG